MPIKTNCSNFLAQLMHLFHNKYGDQKMLSEKIQNPKTNISHTTLKHFDSYMIKIDYFDKKGTKNFENNIPLTYILNPATKLPKSNLELN